MQIRGIKVEDRRNKTSKRALFFSLKKKRELFCVMQIKKFYLFFLLKMEKKIFLIGKVFLMVIGMCELLSN